MYQQGGCLASALLFFQRYENLNDKKAPCFLCLQAFGLVGCHWCVALVFLIQTLTTGGVVSKFSSEPPEKLFCEMEPCIFDLGGLDGMNDVEALHGDCAAEHEGTGWTIKSGNLLRDTI